MKRVAELRTCASCEWVFRLSVCGVECPKCHFGSYGAYAVYGKKAGAYERNQKPWLDKKTAALQAEVYASRPKRKPKGVQPAWGNLPGLESQLNE